MKLKLFSIVLAILLFSVVSVGNADMFLELSVNNVEPEENITPTQSAVNIEVLDERIDYTILSGGEVEVGYTIEVKNIPSGLELDRVSQELQDKLLWTELDIKPMPSKNMILFLILDTTNPAEAENLAIEALNMVTERPNPNFLISGVDVSNLSPWDRDVSVVRMEGSADYAYYISVLNSGFQHFSAGIPSSVNLNSLSPSLKLGIGIDTATQEKFSLLGYQRNRQITSLTGSHSFSLAADLGVSSIETTEYFNQISAMVDIPIDISNLSYSPDSNVTNYLTIYQTNTSASIEGIQEQTFHLSYFSSDDSLFTDVTISFDYDFQIRSLQGTETLISEVNPYGYISKAYLGEGLGLEISSLVYDELRTNTSLDIVVNVKVELRTDLDDTGNLNGFHALTVDITLASGISNYSIARDLATLFANDHGTVLNTRLNTTTFGMDPYTGVWGELNYYSFSNDINNGFTITGESMLMNSPAWTGSGLVPDFDYNGTDYLDYYFIAEMYRHSLFNDEIIPKLSIVWPGLEVFEDNIQRSPDLVPGTTDPTISTKQIYGLSSISKSPSFANLIIAHQVPNNEGTLPVYDPSDSGNGFAVFGFGQPSLTPFTIFSGISNVDTKSNSWIIYSDSPTLPDGQPLDDISITLSYTILTNDQDVLSPIMAALAFEADSEYTSEYLTSGRFSAYQGTVFGPTAHTVSRFNGTEMIYPLIQDYWGVYTTGTGTLEDIFGNIANWRFHYPNSTIAEISMEFTYSNLPIKSGSFFKTGSTSVNNSLIWYSSQYDQATGDNVDRGGPSLANFTTGFSWDTTQYADGYWLLNVSTTDIAGNSGSQIFTLNVDNWATTGNPGVAIHSSSDVNEFSTVKTTGKRIVVETTEDGSPIFGLGLTFLGKTYAMEYDSLNDLYYWDLPFDITSSGTHLASITVYDYSGGSSSVVIQFNVDKQVSPEILGHLPGDNTEIYDNETLNVIVDVYDQDNNGVTASIAIDSGTTNSMSKLNTTAFEYSYAPGTVSPGTHTVTVTIEDNDVFPKTSNLSFSIIVINSTDGTVPTSSSTTPVDNNTSDGAQIPILFAFMFMTMLITVYVYRHHN